MSVLARCGGALAASGRGGGRGRERAVAAARPPVRAPAATTGACMDGVVCALDGRAAAPWLPPAGWAASSFLTLSIICCVSNGLSMWSSACAAEPLAASKAFCFDDRTRTGVPGRRLLDRLAQVVAVHRLEREVGDHQVGLVALELLQRRVRAVRRDDAEVRTREGDLENLAHGHAVVDGEEGAGHGRGLLLSSASAPRRLEGALILEMRVDG